MDLTMAMEEFGSKAEETGRICFGLEG